MDLGTALVVVAAIVVGGPVIGLILFLLGSRSFIKNFFGAFKATTDEVFSGDELTRHRGAHERMDDLLKRSIGEDQRSFRSHLQ